VIYLACPYSKYPEAVRPDVVGCADMAAAKLIVMGHVVYSPLSMTHGIWQHMKVMHRNFDWVLFDKEFLVHCSGVFVLRLPMWNHSEGIKQELEFASTMGLNVFYMEPFEAMKAKYPQVFSERIWWQEGEKP